MAAPCAGGVFQKAETRTLARSTLVRIATVAPACGQDAQTPVRESRLGLRCPISVFRLKADLRI